ncbi:YHYH domain-containing protein [Candidatus Thioglobus sp.]|nr:YHYH domain-containing protein [Candidatus Thioglobus sp.]
MKKLLISLIISISFVSLVLAHSGRTDSSGGHNNRSNGTYHYHNSGSSSSGSYSGNCACPYDTASDGSQCGSRSAWSRSGGASPKCYSNESNYGNNKRYGMYYNSSGSYGVGQAAAYYEGYMEGAAIGNAINILINNSNSNSSTTSKPKKWSCPSGYKRDLADGCIKGFVANLYKGEEAYNSGDYETAIKHFDLLAAHGSANAQLYIGKMYERGVSFKKNDYWAHHWINKAAELGLPEAQYTLGYFYRNEVGVVKDLKQTVKWFKKAGKKGHAKAQFNLGAMYINGDSVSKSLKDAKYWINLAMDNNHPRAEAIWNDFELWKY